MGAELEVYSEMPPLSWEEFTATHPLGSIALDGYVTGMPRYESNGPYLNADHHVDVDRLSTLSTAQQIFMKIRMGLRQAFTRDGEFAPHVFTKDCDQDICLAWFLLHNIEQAEVPSPALNQFVETAGRLDVTAGAFPCNLETREQLGWVFEPYTLFKASGEINKCDNRQYETVIYDVEKRIQQYLRGEGKSVKLDLQYKVIGGGPTWKMIVEEGKDGRVGAFLDGIEAYVVVQDQFDGTWRVTVGKVSEFPPFKVRASLQQMNEMEGCTTYPWDGSDIVGGSPRPGGTTLPPRKIEEGVNIANYGSATLLCS